MDRDLILSKLREIAPSLRERYHVVSLGLFGSVARGDTGPDSDIDVVIRFEEGFKYTLLTLGGIANSLEDALGGPVDVVVDHAGLRPRFREFMEQDLIRVAC